MDTKQQVFTDLYFDQDKPQISYESLLPDNAQIKSKIEKNINNSHGISLISLLMIDYHTNAADITLTFNNRQQMNYFTEYILDTWEKFVSIKKFIRSYKQNGVFMQSLNGRELTLHDDFPSTPSYFNYNGQLHDVIIDINVTDNRYQFSLYRLSCTSKHLTLSYIDADAVAGTNNMNNKLDDVKEFILSDTS